MCQKKIYKFSLSKLSFCQSKKYKIIFGNLGIKTLDTGLITQKHLENLRRKLSKQFKKLSNIKRSKLYIRVLVWKPFTAKPLLSRMGKGVGVVSFWKALVKPGFFLLEIATTEPFFFVNKIVKKAILFFPLKCVLSRK